VTAPVSVSDRFNAAVGCRTDEVALGLLGQLVGLEHEDFQTCSDARIDELMLKATAMLAELEPNSAAEAMLGAQMVGAQRLALRFMERATAPGQPSEFIDANVNRAAKLTRHRNSSLWHALKASDDDFQRMPKSQLVQRVTKLSQRHA
jgi:hypothetical protein